MNGAFNVSAAPVGVHPGTTPARVAPATNGSLMPEPTTGLADALSHLYAMMAKQANQRERDAAVNVHTSTNARHVAIENERKAHDEAREAANQKHGIFDSMGLGSVVGIAIGSPWLAVADMAVHMTHLTPEVLKHFEDHDLEKLAKAANVYGAASGLATLAQTGVGGPGAVEAMLKLGGLVVQETRILGEKNSDLVGKGMMFAGASGALEARTAGVGLVGDKKGAVADEIRHQEEKQKTLVKVATYVGMALAATGACVGTFGTGTPFVAACVGLALSVAGGVVSESKAFGEKSQWIGLGLMGAGALMSGAAAANAASAAASAAKEAAMKSLQVGADVIEASNKALDGADRVEKAVIDHEVAGHGQDAEQAELDAKRLQDVIERLMDTAMDAKEGFRRLASRIQETLQQDTDTKMMAINGMKG